MKKLIYIVVNVLLSLPITIVIICGIMSTKDYWQYDKFAGIQLILSYIVFICCHIILLITLNKTKGVEINTNIDINEATDSLNIILWLAQNIK